MSEWTEQNQHDSEIYTEGYNDGYDACLADIDVVKVVRCKDCGWFMDAEKCGTWCAATLRHAPPDGYCHRGVRREVKANG